MFKVGYKTDKGLVRENNEDSFYVDDKKGIFIVADGMGGHNAGEVASQMAVETIKECFDKNTAFVYNDYSKLIEKAIKEANTAIYKKANQNEALQGMGTTIVFALIKEDKLYLAHVGDSRAYMLTKKGLKQLTEDHSLVNDLIKQGKLSAEEAHFHPMRHVITRALGVKNEVEVDVNTIPYKGGLILLCTDGLTDMLEDKEIEEIVKNTPEPQKACELLIGKANERGGRDNVTVVVVGEREP